jgi:hypothetical protein
MGHTPFASQLRAALKFFAQARIPNRAAQPEAGTEFPPGFPLCFPLLPEETWRMKSLLFLRAS